MVGQTPGELVTQEDFIDVEGPDSRYPFRVQRKPEPCPKGEGMSRKQVDRSHCRRHLYLSAQDVEDHCSVEDDSFRWPVLCTLDGGDRNACTVLSHRLLFS